VVKPPVIRTQYKSEPKGNAVKHFSLDIELINVRWRLHRLWQPAASARNVPSLTRRVTKNSCVALDLTPIEQVFLLSYVNSFHSVYYIQLFENVVNVILDRK